MHCNFWPVDANECLGMVQNIKLQSFLHGPFVVVAVVVVLLLGLSPRAWIGVRDDVENNLMLKLEGAPVHLTPALFKHAPCWNKNEAGGGLLRCRKHAWVVFCHKRMLRGAVLSEYIYIFNECVFVECYETVCARARACIIIFTLLQKYSCKIKLS